MMKNLESNFEEVGTSFKIVAIMSIFETFLIIPPFSFISFVFILKGLSNLTSVNKKLNNDNLSQFITKLTTAAILRFISSIVLLATIVILFFTIRYFRVFFLIPVIILILNYIALRIVFGAIERESWRKFRKFVRSEQSRLKFLYIANNAADKLETAAFFEILSPLIITNFIAWIFRIAGYFNLSKFENIPYSELETEEKRGYVEQTTQPTQHPPTNTEPAKVEKTYCSYCGEQIEIGVKYCSHCGSQIN